MEKHKYSLVIPIHLNAVKTETCLHANSNSFEDLIYEDVVMQVNSLAQYFLEKHKYSLVIPIHLNADKTETCLLANCDSFENLIYESLEANV